MTILWIYNMPLIPEAGGTERITSLVAKGLTAAGHRCLGILLFQEGSDSISYNGAPVTDLYSFLKEQNVDIIINQIAYSKWLLDSFLKKGGARWHNEGGKIISCLHFDPCNPSTIQLLKSCERLTLQQRCALLKQYLLRPYYVHKQQRTEGDIYRYIYDNSDKFITLSAKHFPYIRKVMRIESTPKLAAIGNPLTFNATVTEADLSTKRKTVLVCARMSEFHKRISLILKAWERVSKTEISKEWTLKIVGEGPDLPRYKRYAQAHHLERIEFLGHRSPAEYYREASILLMTSSAEGWGLAITEALQFGAVPIVMNSSVAYSDIIENGVNGILTPNNKLRHFSDAILSLMSTPSLLQKMQKSALKSASRFSYPATILQWIKLINSILCKEQL